jgi:hypothetical protein
VSRGTVGIDELRGAVKVLGACNESFNQRFSAEELLRIYRALLACDWDILPDQWSDRQVRQARLYGVVPQFQLDAKGRNVPHYPRTPGLPEKRVK